MSRMRSVIVASSLVVALLVPAVPAAGRPAAPPSDQAQLQADLGEASRAEQAAVAQVLAARARRQRLDAELATLDGQLATVRRRAEEAAARLQRITQRRRELTDSLARTEAELGIARSRFGESAARMYRGGSSADDYAALVSGADSLHDLYVGASYLEKVADAARDDLEAFLALRARTVREQDALAGEEEATQAARIGAGREEARLAGLRTQQAATLESAEAAETRESAALSSIRARKGEFEQRLAQMQEASRHIGDVLGDQPSGGGAPGRLRMPASGPITSPFGPRVHPIFGDTRVHTGIDIGAGDGAPVGAATAGTVVIAGTQGGFGNTIVVDHGGGLATLYAHLSRITTRVGERVAPGQKIGAVGSSGNSTGPHLHFETRLNGTPVDPMRYL